MRFSANPPVVCCPRCGGQLAPFEVPEGSACGCRTCGGVWVDDRAFAALRQGMEDEVVGVASALVAREQAAQREAAERRAVRCPACAHELIATQISTVRVDFCIAHGTWLDHDDIGAIADAIQIASSGNANRRDWEARLTGDLGVLPKGLVTALGTVIAVGEHARRVRRLRA